MDSSFGKKKIDNGILQIRNVDSAFKMKVIQNANHKKISVQEYCRQAIRTLNIKTQNEIDAIKAAG